MGVPLLRALDVVTTQPARILQQATSIGHLQVGGVADIVVFDPQEQWQVTPEGLHSQGKHTPFGFARSGMALPGRVKATWVHGHLAYSA